MKSNFVLLLALVSVAIPSRASQNDHRRVAPVVAPSFSAGARIHSQLGVRDSSLTTATLVLRLADVHGEPIPHANFSIPEIRFGGLTDLQGWGWIRGIPAGDRFVRWNIVGVPRPDSARVRFGAGQAETLDVHVALPHEPGRNERPWDGKTRRARTPGSL